MDLEEITQRVKAINQLERYAKSTAPSITISGMNRFSQGFRDRLSDFFQEELERELNILENEIKKL